MFPTEPPARPAAEARGFLSPLYVVLGVFAVIVVVVFFAMSGKNANSTFAFVGSSIKPTSGNPRLSESPPMGGRPNADLNVVAEAQPPAAPAPAGGPALPAAVDRKIVYTARLDLVVKNIDAAEKVVDDLLTTNGGRLVSSESRGDAGSKRTASYKLEVPSGKFRALVSGLRGLGVPERDKVDSDDLTEEFVDIQARVRHLKAEEDNLLKLLAERARGVEEQLAIRRQIQPIREQIEKAEGRQTYIETRAALSTVTLNLREEANYVPPTVEPPPSPPTFGDRVTKTFDTSWKLLVSVGEWLALVGVAVGPWLPFVLPAGLLGVWTARRLGRTPPAA